jgi:hypothetical protein
MIEGNEGKRMKANISPVGKPAGNVTVVALMLLAVLTLIGLSASRIAGLDIQIAGNQVPYKQNFYVAEGGIHREAAEVGRGEYPVTNLYNFDALLADEGGQVSGSALPGPSHDVSGTSYDFDLYYQGYYLPPAGYSVIHFSRYDYFIEAWGEDVRVGSRYYKIGPKAS